MHPSKKSSLSIGILSAVGVVLFAVVGVGVYVQQTRPDSATDDRSSGTLSQSDSQAELGQSRVPSSTPSIAKSDLDLHPQLKDLKYDATIREIAKREDPVVDGWDTERFNELAGKQLKLVGKLLVDRRLLDEKHVAEVSVPGFRGVLRPSKLSKTFDDSTVTVLRAAKESADSGSDFRSAMGAQGSLFDEASSRFKFKVVRVDVSGDSAETTSYFQMIGSSDSPWRHDTVGDVHRVQVNSTWDCVWDVRNAIHPKLKSVRVSDYEEVYAKSDSLFTDCTQSQFANVAALGEQLIYGRDHWYGNLESSIGVEGRGNGLAIGDANGDGLEDLYICQPAALPNKLMLRKPDGSFLDASAQSQVDWLDSTRGALFVDIDNDGDQDLVVSLSSDIMLHENDGAGRFTLRETIPTNSRLFSINALDFDRDGRLDLYACGYSGANQIRPEDIFASPVPYHDANNGAENTLLRQASAWSFVNVTEAVGLDQNNLRFSLASTWDDMDLDGDLDLYVANDFGRNNLYRNDDGKFVDVAAEAGVEDIGPGMSCAWGDYNNDGLVDLYVSNMFSSAGSRITHTPQFKPDASSGDLAGFQRHARGNSLFRNNGDGTFTDRAIESGTKMGRWAWGSLLVDINNDGWRDVYVTNGFVTADNNNDL